MKLLLKKRQKVWHEAGEVVEVSPADAGFLLAVGAAVIAAEKKEAPKKEQKKKK